MLEKILSKTKLGIVSVGLAANIYGCGTTGTQYKNEPVNSEDTAYIISETTTKEICKGYEGSTKCVEYVVSSTSTTTINF